LDEIVLKLDGIILKALLDRLWIYPIITRYEDIQQVQQAVYEESVHGVDLGYVFGDYPVGKFSPELRDVHKELSNALVE
jgi:hypothetical protein